MADSDLITAFEVAEILGIAPGAVYVRAQREDGFPKLNAVGPSKLWSRAVVEDYAAGQKAAV